MIIKILLIIIVLFFLIKKAMLKKEKFENGVEIDSKTKNTNYMDYLLDVRDKIEKGESYKTKLKRDEKITKLNEICNWTKPEMFMIQTNRLPVYWKMDTYKTHSLPYELNNFCEKNIRNCL